MSRTSLNLTWTSLSKCKNIVPAALLGTPLRGLQAGYKTAGIADLHFLRGCIITRNEIRRELHTQFVCVPPVYMTCDYRLAYRERMSLKRSAISGRLKLYSANRVHLVLTNSTVIKSLHQDPTWEFNEVPLAFFFLQLKKILVSNKINCKFNGTFILVLYSFFFVYQKSIL